MRTAFVLSGGGSLGAVQVGMLRALAARDVLPDVVIGTSAGAFNAAYLAGRGVTDECLAGLAAHWQNARRSDLYPFDPWRLALSMLGRQSSLFSSRGLRKTLAANLAIENLEDATLEVHVVATDLLSGKEVVMSTGDAASAVLASAAIPGLLPPVQREGRILVDGALANNAAISVAVGLGVDRVFVLPTGYACALAKAPDSAVGVAMHSLGFLIQQRLIADIAFYSDRIELKVIPPLCPLAVSSIDFTHARELIDRAYTASLQWIDDGGLELPHPEQFLSLHHHG